MKTELKSTIIKALFGFSFSIFLITFAYAKDNRAMTVQDVMQFKSITSPKLSDDGRWIAYSTVPDRGDPDGFLKSTDSDTIIYKIKNGDRPQFSKNSLWAVMSIRPKLVETENAEKDKPKAGMALIHLTNGETTKFENVKSFKFSEDSKWLVYQITPENSKTKEGKDVSKHKQTGQEIVLRQLETASELSLQNVTEFVFDSLSTYFTYIVSDPASKKSGIYTIDLHGGSVLPLKVAGRENFDYSSISWTSRTGRLAFISAKEEKENDTDSCEIIIYDNLTKEIASVVTNTKIPEGWFIPFKNSLIWTKDGKRLFFGLKPNNDSSTKEDKITFTDSTLLDVKKILKKTELDLWHWNDPRIKTNQRNWWGNNKDSVYRSLYNIESKQIIILADEKMTDVPPADNPNYILGYDQSKYIKSVTWDNDFSDAYIINLNTGIKKLIGEKLPEGAYLSPLGKYVIYYKNRDWFLYDCLADTTKNLTKRVGVAFYDEEFDQPADPPSYGFACWLANDEALAIYDKFDIWKFYTSNYETYLNQTGAEGRENSWTFRLYKLEPEKEYFSPNIEYTISAFNQKSKEVGIFSFNFEVLGVINHLMEQKRYNALDKSQNGKYLYSRESYDEFPDLWFSNDSLFKNVKKLTDVNPVMKELNFGKAELVEWTNFSKDSLQGYIIKPNNFDPKKKYPLLVYYYERFSNQFYYFFQPRMNHRPCYPLYTGDGYIIFMPDIKYKIGQPGQSSLSCVVSGVRSLASKGFIDTNAIAIQGHSWGGYETAYMITQTPLFTAACAGAPVGNMTSAYSGIRLESGLARQMQYEKQQSRIGGTIWDSLTSYINNSPIFHAKGTKTPFLIMFGDEDNAVPWQQGVELYLAYRRLNKECYLLQYHNEPHIPRKYQNKLDYAIRMKEFFDHYCLKKPAPDWMTNGIEYRGK